MIPVVWIKNLQGKAKTDFETVLRNSSLVTSRLKEIIEERLVDLDKVSTNDYQSPNWSHLQAHKNGRKEELLFLLNILKFKES